MDFNPEAVILGDKINLFGALEEISLRIGYLAFVSNAFDQIDRTPLWDGEPLDLEEVKKLESLASAIVEILQKHPQTDKGSFKHICSNNCRSYFIEFSMDGETVAINIPYNTPANPEIIVMLDSPLRLSIENEHWVLSEYLPNTPLATIIESPDDFSITSVHMLDRSFKPVGKVEFRHLYIEKKLRVREGFSTNQNGLFEHCFTWSNEQGVTYQFVGTPEGKGWKYRYYVAHSEPTTIGVAYNCNLKIMNSDQIETFESLNEYFRLDNSHSAFCSVIRTRESTDIDTSVVYGGQEFSFQIEIKEDRIVCSMDGAVIRVFDSSSGSMNQTLPLVEDYACISFERDESGIKRFYYTTDMFMLILESNYPFYRPSLVLPES